jgi:hypothetical protein
MHHFDGNASPDFASAHPGYDAVVKFADMVPRPLHVRNDNARCKAPSRLLLQNETSRDRISQALNPE